jgi:hypothetical protein
VADGSDRSNRPASGTALARLWDAYDNELQAAGVLMFEFGGWRQRVSNGKEACSIGGAIAALQDDIRIARAHDDSHDARLLGEWVERLRDETDQATP